MQEEQELFLGKDIKLTLNSSIKKDDDEVAPIIRQLKKGDSEVIEPRSALVKPPMKKSFTMFKGSRFKKSLWDIKVKKQDNSAKNLGIKEEILS